VLRAQGTGHIVESEPGRVGVGQLAGDAGPLASIVLARWMRSRGAGRDNRSDAAPGLDDAGTLELGVDAGYGVGVDPEIDGELADRRQLIARPDTAGGNRRAEPALELRVDGRRVAWVDGQERHFNYYTSSLVQLLSSRPRKDLHSRPDLSRARIA
jgi:hypothetical protein